MVSARFLSQGQKWRGIGQFARDIWADWLHVGTLAVAAPARGHGFGKQLMKVSVLPITRVTAAGLCRGYFLLAAHAAGVSSGTRCIGKSPNPGRTAPR